MNDVSLEAKPRKASAAAAQRSASKRIQSIDLLRGLVMVLMALDHTRAIFHGSDTSVHDVSEPALFLTRWITHICAPSFIFLAGLSAYLFGQKTGERDKLAWYLLSRGLLLIVLELTLVHAAWVFSGHHSVFALQVIWAIGVSMVALAGLIYLPLAAIAVIGIGMIVGHNLLDGIQAESLGSWAWLWHVLHERGSVYPVPDVRLIVAYPVIPWIGVMAAGYALGPIYALDGERRIKLLLGTGTALIAAFVALRVPNLYGDPAAWEPQATWWSNVLAVLDCEKYPPSLNYLLMTLGPALVLLGLFEYVRGAWANWIIVFGQVPFFYYVAHLAWIGLLALLLTMALNAGADAAFDKISRFTVDLPGVYVLWVFVVATLYPLCARFSRAKHSGKGWWWRYL